MTGSGDWEGSDAILDHVLLASFPPTASLSAVRVLDDLVSLDLGSETVETHLSDHFGVLATASAPGNL
jgi:hypothetical protein